MAAAVTYEIFATPLRDETSRQSINQPLSLETCPMSAAVEHHSELPVRRPVERLVLDRQLAAGKVAGALQRFDKSSVVQR